MNKSNRKIAVDEHQPERDHARPQDPLVHLQVDAVAVQLAGADVVEDRPSRSARRATRPRAGMYRSGKLTWLNGLNRYSQGQSRTRVVSEAAGGQSAPPRWARRVCHGATLYSAPTCPPGAARIHVRSGANGAPTERPRRNRAGASAALGRQPRGHLRVRARAPAPRRRAVRHRRHARAPRRGRHRGRVRLRPDRGPAARRRPGPDLPPRDLRRHPRPPRRPRAARSSSPTTASACIDLVVVNVKPFAPEVGARPHRHRRGDRDDRRRRRGAARRRGAQRGRRRRGLRPGHYAPRPRRAADARPGVAPTRATGSPPTPSARSPPTTRRSRPTSTRSAATPTRSAWRWSSRRSPTCRTARTRTSGRRSTARRPTAPARSPTRTQLHGAPPTFNNLLDLDAAYRIAADYTAPTVAITKHTDPVGLASARGAGRGLPAGARHGPRLVVRRHRRASTASSTARPPARSPPTRTRRSSRPASRGRARDPARRSRASSCSPSRRSPTEGMRDYGIANLDFKRVGGGLLVEALDARRPRPRPAPGRDPAPPDAGRADRPAVRVARGAPRPLERDRARPQRRDGRDRRGAGEPQRVGGHRAAPGRRPREARGHGVGRLLPVPRRHPDRGQRRASRRSSSRAAPSATRWRSRSPTATTSRWSSPAAATSGTDGRSAWNSCSRSRWSASPRRRRSPPRGSWAGASATRRTGRRPRPCATTMDETDIAGTIVIGEGERDEAPMLYIGEQVGRHGRRRRGRGGRHRGRSARGHEPRRHRAGRRDHGARGVREGRPDPRPGHVPREAVRRAGRRRLRRHHAAAGGELPPDRRGAAPQASRTSR